MSIDRPTTPEEWDQLELVMARASQPMRSELFLMLDMDIRRGLTERSVGRKLGVPPQEAGK
jgi:hypothetical protein